jgi:hypothetical protein
LLLAFIHITWPSIRIDSITLILLFIAALPWLAPFVKSFEFSNGFKVELRDMNKAIDKAREAGLVAITSPDSERAEHAFQKIAAEDPNLALAGLRIEIERRLVRLSEKHNINIRSRGVGQLLRSLDQNGVLTSEQRRALADLISLLNSAVHGASVDPQVAEWAMEIAPGLLESLNRLIELNGSKVFVQKEPPSFALNGDLWIKPDS